MLCELDLTDRGFQDLLSRNLFDQICTTNGVLESLFSYMTESWS